MFHFKTRRPIAFWILVIFLALALENFITGQILALFNYDLAVQFGFKTKFGQQINRAFLIADIFTSPPLVVISLIGLFLRKRWVLLTLAALMGMAVWWAIVHIFLTAFLVGIPGYSLIAGFLYWMPIISSLFFGVWGLFYLIFRGEELIAKE